jgi:hypothetical protein
MKWVTLFGPRPNVQFMMKDSKRCASTSGGGSLNLQMASQTVKRCTKPASRAMRGREIAILSSHITRVDLRITG